MVLVSETLPTILSNLGKQFSILNLVFNFETLPTILSNLGKQCSNSFPKSIYVVSHTRRCLDGSTLATLFCLNYFAANLGYKYLFLLHEKQSTLGVWKTAPTSAAWATAFYSTCSHFCNCCTCSHSVANSALQELPGGAGDQRCGRERRRAVQGARQEQVWRGRRLHQPQLQP